MPAPVALTFEELKALDKQVTEGPRIAQDAAFGAFVGSVVGFFDGGFIDGAVKGALTGAAVALVRYKYQHWVAENEHDGRRE